MSPRAVDNPAVIRRPGRGRARIAACIALALAASFALFSSSGWSGATSTVVPVAQPVIGLPVSLPTLIGASPGETPGETWGYSTSGGFQIVRYTPSDGWRVQAPPLEAHGKPLSGFKPAVGPLAGATTAGGGVAIAGEDEAKVGQVLVRDPGSGSHPDPGFEQAPTLTSEPAKGVEPAEPNALLKEGETLFPSGGEGTLMAPVDQEDGHTGVLLVPHENGPGVPAGVLFYNGTAWAREPICTGTGSNRKPGEPCTKPAAGFKVLAIQASSPNNAWLLAQSGAPADGVVLFSRETGGGETRWIQRTLGESGARGTPGWLGAHFAQAKSSFENASHETVSVSVSSLTYGQPLTVTAQGVWADGQLGIEIPHQPLQKESFTLYYDIAAGRVTASWCDMPAEAGGEAGELCSHPLGSSLPGGAYRSFAWSEGGSFGTRVITGLNEGVTLSLQGTSFARVLGNGGESGTRAGAAFSTPLDGWLANRLGGPLTHLTSAPEPDRVQSWPVPFRRPLTAIAEQPGSTPGDVSAQAIAVGQDGQAAHYYPGEGWTPEALLSPTSGLAQTPNMRGPDMRGVAWPEPDRAYAVGTNGAMWLWRAETGLWEPDPARPPNLFLANFTGIAFDPGNPARGYAIGQQGVLLGYGKSWEQEKLPQGLEGSEGANFTSIAFAGKEALVTYQMPNFREGKREYTGGVLVNDGDGSGWRIDVQAGEALGKGDIPVRVAGLPDGGAAIAGTSGLVERQSQGSPWEPAPAGSLGGTPAALAVFREADVLRVAASIEAGGVGAMSYDIGIDEALQETPPAGQAPVATAPYRLPGSGYLLRETSTGWRDEEHEDYPTPNTSKGLPVGETGFDWPAQPDAVLALALAPDGSEGWAVGGQTGEANAQGLGATQEHAEAIQTSGVMRYPGGGGAPVGFSPSPERTGSDNVAFAIGGDAQCATACADLAKDRLGPDEWLSNAIAQAGQTQALGVRAFIYTGPRLAAGLGGAGGIEAGAFEREEERYAQVLASAAGSLPVFAAPSAPDLDRANTLGSFGSAMQTLDAPQGAAEPPASVAPVSHTGTGTAYFSFDSTGAAGTVRVIVLDYSGPVLGATQQCWLAAQLAQAKAERAPAIVIGSRELNPTSSSGNVAADAAQVIPIVVNGTPPAGCALNLPSGGASAYFYNYPQQNRSYPITAGGASIPAFGSGTLGYVDFPSQQQTQFLGAAGSLLAEVEVVKRNPATNRAPVTAKLIPDIADLAIDATNGVLLRRSQPALFSGLARQPHAGGLCGYSGAHCEFQPDPYVPIPSPCQGSGCATGILPYYTFTSSKPDVGNFVEPDPASPEGTTVLQGPNGKPILDSHSGLFCAYNAGTTTVTVQAGGLSSSEQVTVLSGSVEQPCGTTPLSHPPVPAQQAGLPAPLPAPAPSPAVTPNGVVPPPPPPPVVPVALPVHARPPAPPALPLAPAQLFPVLPLLPPPAPSPARPTPPSGTAQVSQTSGVPEQEREEERATEMVHHMVAYGPHPDERPLPGWPLGLVLIAAAAGVAIRRPRTRFARVGTGLAPRANRWRV